MIVKYRNMRFTLIEILAVMLLMVLISGLVTSVYHPGGSLDNLDRAASRMKAALEQTRSRAIAQNKPMALVIPSFAVTQSSLSGTEAADGGYRGTAALVDGKFELWNTPDWDALPEAVAVVSTLEPAFNASGDAAVSAPQWENDFSGFLTIGEIALESGSIPDGTKIAVVFDALGQCQNGTLYITVAEAEPGNSGLIPSGSKAFKTLKINGVTGQVIYVKYETL